MNEKNQNKNKINHSLLETYVLGLLSHHALKQNKAFLPYYKENVAGKIMEFDALLPDGINQIAGNTIVEIKMNNASLPFFLDRIKDFYPKYKNVLLIIGNEIKENDRRNICQLTKDWPEDFNLILWDNHDIDKLSDMDKTYSKKLDKETEKINLGIVESVFNKHKDNKWQEDSDFYISELNQLYKDDRVVLFLGAGVSIDAGIPNWESLISNLNLALIEGSFEDQLIKEDKEKLAKLLCNKSNSSPLIDASYIKEGFGEKDFVKKVREELYKNEKPIDEQIILRSIARSAHPSRGKIGYESIITYNFDDLLEKHMKSESIKVKSIYREGEFSSSDELPIYHVHGFLPKDDDKYGELAENLLVFSEDGYHHLQSDYYSWANLVQINALSKNIGLFIGFSLTDPNQRRLLNLIAKRTNTCNHFVLLQRQFQSIEEEIPVKILKEFSNIHHLIQEKILKRLGLKVIWYEKHEQLPDILKRIAQRV